MALERDRTPRSTILSDLELARTVDASGMLDLVTAFPQQCERAVSLVRDFIPPAGEFRNIVVLGMGGSAIGGDLLRALLEADGGAVPVVVSRDYRCPAFVDRHTLCIAGSYSGNTEETLAATEDAFRRGATVLPITTGGALTARAQEKGLALITVPGGQPPRSALGFMFLPALVAVGRMGLCRDFGADIAEAIEVLSRQARVWGMETPEAQNEAKRVALQFHRSLPVIYGSQPLTGVVALRWKCQFNENAKMHALWNNLPELDHNEICGWRSARRQGKLRWVFIRDRQDAPRLGQRLEITRSVMAQHSLGHTDVWGTGQSLLARAMSGILLGDFVTTYAALLNHTDPTDIREIDVLKEELAAVG